MSTKKKSTKKKAATKATKKTGRPKGTKKTGRPKGTKKTGRPKGSRTQTTPTAEAPPSRCPKCDSTDRDEYFNRRELEIEGVTPDLKAFNRIVIRRTRCRNCGQQRDDRSHEMRW